MTEASRHQPPWPRSAAPHTRLGGWRMWWGYAPGGMARNARERASLRGRDAQVARARALLRERPALETEVARP